MLKNSNRFLYAFFILFLSILLLMFAMFVVMVHYDRDVQTGERSSAASSEKRESSAVRKSSFPDLTPLYRANLFAMDLCLIVLAEALLIMLFVRFTMPATLIATLIIMFMTLNVSHRLRDDVMSRLMSRFVSNRYATLSHTDMLLLVVLSGLIMAFLMSVLLKHSGMEAQSEESEGAPPPPPPSPPPAP